MFEIKCDSCGKNAKVPFKPRAGRPIYCSACFSKRISRRRERSNPNFGLNSKNAWARRESGFKGKKEEAPASIFKKY